MAFLFLKIQTPAFGLECNNIYVWMWLQIKTAGSRLAHIIYDFDAVFTPSSRPPSSEDCLIFDVHTLHSLLTTVSP